MIYGGNFNIYLNVIISNNLPIFNIFPKIVWKKKLNIISWLHFPISSIFFFIGFPEWKLPTFAYPYPFWLAPIPPPPNDVTYLQEQRWTSPGSSRMPRPFRGPAAWRWWDRHRRRRCSPGSSAGRRSGPWARSLRDSWSRGRCWRSGNL